MNTEQIIEIVKATAGSIDSLIQQTAYFFAVQASAKWLSVSLPLLILFSITLKVKSTLKDEINAAKLGMLTLLAWGFFAVTLFTGVRGIAHIVQASLAPSIYAASELGGIEKLFDSIKK